MPKFITKSKMDKIKSVKWEVIFTLEGQNMEVSNNHLTRKQYIIESKMNNTPLVVLDGKEIIKTANISNILSNKWRLSKFLIKSNI